MLNGSGYSMGLRGEKIPLIARIMAVANAYSAITIDRPYRTGWRPNMPFLPSPQG
ncbi:HD-GYP domain-containing protein [Capsulimonas corticalis]|uniref:HD-GYP domain-containing protein n=1 Tax=Capsulimonas corticalis TaxID=2219043 RepID=UPI000E647F62